MICPAKAQSSQMVEEELAAVKDDAPGLAHAVGY